MDGTYFHFLANGQLILRKISKNGGTRCHILTLKCTKFDFRCGCAPDPAGGAYSASPGPLAVFKGPTSKGREGEGGGMGREERGREGRVAPNWDSGSGSGGGEGRGEGQEGLGRPSTSFFPL